MFLVEWVLQKSNRMTLIFHCYQCRDVDWEAVLMSASVAALGCLAGAENVLPRDEGNLQWVLSLGAESDVVVNELTPRHKLKGHYVVVVAAVLGGQVLVLVC